MTRQQKTTLTYLSQCDRAVPTERVRQVLNRSFPSVFTMFTYDRTHAILSRLHQQGFVARSAGRPAVWSITTLGKKLLDA